MKKSILNTFLTFFASIFAHLFILAEKKFTLSLIEGLPSGASATEGNRGGQREVVSIKVDNGATIDRSDEPVLDPYSTQAIYPAIMQQTIVSASGSGAAAITAYFMNEDAFNETTTNNGSGSATVTNTYLDGWAGLGYNRLASSGNSGHGVKCFGLTMIFKVTSGGAQDPAGLAGSALEYNTYNNLNGGNMQIGTPLNEGILNTQYQIGTMTLKRSFFMSSINQFSYVVPVADTVIFMVLTKPQR